MATSVLLASVLIADLEYRDTTTWRSCKARDKSLSSEIDTTIPLEWDDGNGHAIPLITHTIPQQPGTTEVGDIDFDDFKLDSINNTEDYTLFHGKAGGLGTYGIRKTTMIRYKTVCVVVDGGTPFPTKSSNWSYAMIRTSFDAENTLIEGSPEETNLSSTVTATLKFRFPGFTSSQLGPEAHLSLTSILNTPTNWELILTKGAGTGTVHTPTTVSLGTPTESASSYPDFGVAYIPITLGATFSGVSSGTYSLSARFKKNDAGDVLNSYLPVPESFEITVQLTLGTATPTQPVIITADGAVQISVTIETGIGS